MNEEEKGFVIRDKRSFDQKGDLKEEPKGGREEKKEEKAQKEAETKTEEREQKAESKGPSKEERPPLPEVNFSSLIFSLSSSALLHFGEIEDPATGQKKKDLPLAKHTIDTISMLREKTQGNLTEEERKFIDNILTDLRWRYVKAKE